MSLKINNLHISREGKEIVKGVTIEVAPGEVHALMGQNGSGKSSLANALMGHPKYVITSGTISIDDEDLTVLKPHERATKGLFLSMQHPPEVSGVTVAHFLRVITTIARRESLSIADFSKLLKEKMSDLKIDAAFMHRGLNEGFSGGEKKRMEILQLALLEPKYAVLDETDSGLDVDALKIVSDGVNKLCEKGMGVLLITHHMRILKELVPEKVYVMKDGIIVASGGSTLAEEIEKDGFTKW